MNLGSFEELLGLQAFEQWKLRHLGASSWASEEHEELVSAIVELLGDASGEGILSSLSGEVHAWFHTLEGHHKTTVVTREAARSLWQSGMTIYLPHHAKLDPLCRALERALFLPRGRVGASVFLQHEGARTVRHFDSLDILVVQVGGRKTWWIGPNSEAPDPLMSCAENDPPAERLAYYSHLPETGELHEGWTPEERRLTPGSVLYVPRGFWHATQTFERGISVHFVLRVPTWLDVVSE